MVTSVSAIRSVLGILKFVGLNHHVLDSDFLRSLLGNVQFMWRERFRDSSNSNRMVAERPVRKESNERAVDTRRQRHNRSPAQSNLRNCCVEFPLKFLRK